MQLWRRVFPGIGEARLAAFLSHLDDLAPPRPPGPPAACTLVASDRDEGVLLGGVVAGLVGDLLARADERVRAHRLVADRDAVSRAVRAHAVRQATTLGARHLLRRLDAARGAGTLPGDTPEERYAAFAAAAASPEGIDTLVADLPDVVGWLRHVTSLRLDAATAVLDDTAEQWDAVVAHLPGPLPGDGVVGIDLGAGDTHGGGASVAVLHLASGARVVTKPRSLAVEQGVAAFTGWFGARVGHPLPAPASWTTGRRGWVEHVEAAAAPSSSYVATSGVLLAALHLMNATDIHYENVLTDRHGLPVVVDAESVLTPAVEGTDRPADGLLGVGATGMLSLRRQVPEAPGGPQVADLADLADLDAGALGYRPGARSPYSSWRVVDPGRDTMRLEMTPVDVDHPGPVPAGVRRDGAAADELTRAFAGAMEHALAHREEVARALERSFADGLVRYIHRPTMLYAQVLRMSTHPAFASARDRARAWGRLAVLGPVTPEPVLVSELAQLADGDLPSFAVPIRGRTLLDGRGSDTGGRTTRPPLDRCTDAVRRLTSEDVAREVDEVREGLTTW